MAAAAGAASCEVVVGSELGAEDSDSGEAAAAITAAVLGGCEAAQSCAAECPPLLPPAEAARVVAALAPGGPGYAVVDGAFPAAAAAAACAEAERAADGGAMWRDEGALSVRSDWTRHWDGATALLSERGAPLPAAALRELVQRLRGVAAELAAAGHPAGLLVPREAQIAVYDEGGSYAPHYDAGAPGERAGGGGAGAVGAAVCTRSVTCIAYLGGGGAGEWAVQRDGGALRLWPPGQPRPGHLDIAPAPGRLLLFDAAAVRHEVRPCRRRRSAVTLWLHRAPPAGAAPAPRSLPY
eukprot:TRINITY_DN24380_c0_g1_i1.p2 TRINITY_DN24380_c0_g1~~TRINITY_DN24380_c0_g1_i1.p2  ORF type:complete len:296 (+),score=98.00 TRINITY_DN24380_c0_g1_i1:80-967(+)